MLKSRLTFLLLAVLVGGALLERAAFAALVDAWRASDLAALNDGDSAGSWSSISNRTLTGSLADQPLLRKNVTPAGGPAVRFNLDWLRASANSPVAGLTNFSIALVFSAGAVGGNNSFQWYGKSGIIDAEQGGVTRDWGVVIDQNGQLGLGIGQPDLTVYTTTAPSLVDNNYHAAVFTWGGGQQTIYVDNRLTNVLSGASSLGRNDAGLSFGATHTGAGGASQRFVGDLVEVRFYDTTLTDLSAAGVIQDLVDNHIAPGRPVIRSFTANPSQILVGTPVTLSWNVTNVIGIQIDNGVGWIASPVGNLQVFPRTNTTYTLTSTNVLGMRTAQCTVLVDQGIPVANSLSVITLINTSLGIRLSGSDPQGSNLVYTVATSPLHGTLAGSPPNLTYAPDLNFIGNDQFTFKVNDGEFDSPPATVAIRVLPPPTAPSAIMLSTTNISPSAAPGSFIASLRAIDVNPDDTHTFLLIPGMGDAAQFVLSGNRLSASATFAGGMGKTFTIRVRATDSTGLSVEQDLSLAVTATALGIVINEVHYNPADNTVREEFIELQNPTSSDIDVSLWRLTGAVGLTIPQGYSIPPGGFLVLAEDPTTILSRYGVAAVGPWTGNLSSDGETLTVEDSNGRQVNQVSYSPEFPWPVGADGGGGSMALVNPGLDNDLGSSWRTELPPSPGRTNSVFAVNSAPNIRQVRHSPQSPASTNAIAITAKVTDPDGVGSVALQYQVVSPGNYLPSVLPVPVAHLVANPALQPTPNPVFEAATNWLTLPMVDNGSAGDVKAGDDVYTALLPPQPNRSLIRYRIVVTDTLGASLRAPFEDDPSLNFGCFVYDGVPAYQGVGPQVLQSLPTYYLIARALDVSQCVAYDGTYQLPQFGSDGLAHLSRFAFNWPGTMVYDGKVYDHIRYRLHGANGRYQPGKRNWRFEFNRGRYLAARKQNGDPFPRKWAHLSTGKGSNNRIELTFGLNEVLNYYLWNKVGVPAPQTIYFHFRVLDGLAEAADQYNNDFWGLNWAQEDYDGRFLDSHNLAKGNLYKLINAPRSLDPSQDMVGQQRYQAPFAVTNGTDGSAIQAGLLTAQTSDWIRAHVNCSAWYHYHAICEAVRNYDFWPDANKNAAWYFEPPYSAANDYHGRFWTLPWDTDCTWGATWNSGQDLVYNGIFLAASHPDLQIEYANTIRQVRDLLIQQDQVNPLIDAFAAQIRDFVPADLARWSNAPAGGGNYVSLSSTAGFVSPALSGGLAACVQDMKDFMFLGGTKAWWVDRQSVSAGGWVTRLDSLAADSAIPSRPTITYAGPINFPVTGLNFRSSAFADPQGAATFAAIQWRLAEVTPTNMVVTNPAQLKLEWDAVWDSGPLTNFSSQIQIPAVSAIPGHLYRARVRHKDSTGRWSNWSAPLQFMPASVDIVSELQQSLVISEIMYNPPTFDGIDGSELEFIELRNTGTNTLDLSGLFFSAGITFTFTNGTSLSPGQYYLLGRNAAALQSKYPGLTVNGIYSGKLDNNGETITIAHPYGIDILSVTYGNRAPWPVAPDGYGFSLVLDGINPQQYRSSSQVGGSPGALDPPSTVSRIVINEILSSSVPPSLDTIELYNPTSGDAALGGWFLTDDPAYPWKFRIPDGITLPKGCYLKFDETQFNPSPGVGSSFALSSLGEEVYLFSGDSANKLTGYSHGLAFGGAADGESFGRYINSVGEEQFPPQLATTLGTNNLGPRVGPVVISEINCSPAVPASAFVELCNLKPEPVSLYDPSYPTNTWQVNGLGFVFPRGIQIPGLGFLLLVGSDPVAFRAQQNINAQVQIFQYPGVLQTNGETLALVSPGLPSTNGVPFISVDKVKYGVALPWPEVYENGASLQRIDPAAYGNDPINWKSASPNPGARLPVPRPELILQVSLDPNDGQPVLSFTAQANRPYTLDYKSRLEDLNWNTLARIPTLPATRTETIKDPEHAAARFYRVATPGL